MVGFDSDQLAQALTGGPVVRVLVASHAGSVPRETGTSMLVRGDDQIGTIGGGALEWDATARARDLLISGRRSESLKVPLGPALGQCCGGSVSLVLERFDQMPGDATLRALGDSSTPSLAVLRAHAALRAGKLTEPQIIDGWIVEPLSPTPKPLWIYGAGHVGRALVDTLAGLPFEITWVDTAPDRFPETVPDHAGQLIAQRPEDAVAYAPDTAQHLVLTYSHATDLELCHAILSRPFGRLGLIGSATKAARFRTRLQALGHGLAQIARIECPIGDPSLGKAPKAIAISVAHDLLCSGAVPAANTGEHRVGTSAS